MAEAQTGPIQKVLTDIQAAVDKWCKNNPPEVVNATVHRMLEENQKKVVLTLLGFDSRWGNWEIDHCNGRSGNTAIGEWLAEKHEVAIKEWLSQVKLPEMTTKLRQHIEKELRDRYERELSSQLYKLVQEKAQRDAAEVLASLNVDQLCLNLKKVRALIEPKAKNV